MTPEFRSLIWKEWTERRRLLVLGLILMLIYAGFCLAYETEYRTRAMIASYFTGSMLFGWLGAILLAMSTAQGEIRQRTLSFTASLPISLRQVAWARLIVGGVCLALPILLGALVLAPLLGMGIFEQGELRPVTYGPESPSFLSRPGLAPGAALSVLGLVTGMAVVMALYQFALVSLIGTVARSEEMAGFLGAIVMLIATSLSTIRPMLQMSAPGSGAADWVGALLPGSLAICWGYADWDGSQYTDLELAPFLSGPLAANLALTLLLGVGFAWRYGRQLPRAAVLQRRFQWLGRVSFPRLALRLPGRHGALVWLNSRQSVALSLSGLCLASLITAVTLTGESGYRSPVERFLGSLPSTTWVIGMVWGVILAAALYSNELTGGLEQFWRSRPIPAATWFWIKYVIGLGVLILALDGIPTLLIQFFGPQVRRQSGMGVAYWACLPLLHALLYSLAVAVVCRWRRSIPAAITALLLYALLDQLLLSIPVSPRLSTLDVYNRLQQLERDGQAVNLTAEGYPLVYGVVVGVTLVAVAFAARRVIPPTVRSGLAGLALLLLWSGAPAWADDVPALQELTARLEAQESPRNPVEVRVSTRLKRTPAGQQQASTHRAPLPAVEFTQYEVVRDGSRLAWTEFDAQGAIKTRMTFDGSLMRQYQPTRRDPWQQGSITAQSRTPRLPVILPDQILHDLDIDLMQLASMNPTVDRVADGNLRISAVRAALDPQTGPIETRFEISLDPARDLALTRIQRDLVVVRSQQVTDRTVITVSPETIDDAQTYPRQMEQQVYSNRTDDPSRPGPLTLWWTVTTTIESVSLPERVPDSTFENAFPAGARYIDMRDRTLYEVAADNTARAFVPQPRGIRGAVLVYHLGWISMVVVVAGLRSRASVSHRARS